MLLVCFPTLWGCAKRNVLPENELFRRIQIHEAAIDRGEQALRTAESCREAYELAERNVCDESEALCALTQDAKQTDATHRCVIASDTCRAVRERTRALCATPAEP